MKKNGLIVLFFVVGLSCGLNKSKTKERITYPTTEFTISTSSDTTVFGSEGTRIFIRANSFQFPDGTMATDSVKIQVKEFYKKSDMLLANLSTVSDNRLLESGGMIFIEATSKGQKLSLASGKTIIVHFPKPSSGESKEMDLFYADNTSTDSSVTNWDIDTTIKLIKDGIGYMSYGYEWISTNDSTEFEYIPALDSCIKNYEFSDSTLAALKKFGTSGLETWFTIGKDGVVKNPRIVGTIDKASSDEIKKFLLSLPRFVPGKNKHGQIVEIKGTIDLTTEPVIGFKTDKEYSKAFDVKYSKFEKTPIRNVSDAELNYYIFSVSKLGWINCDRFLDKEETIDLIAKIPYESNTVLKMVFPDIKSVLIANSEGGVYTFKNVPVNRQVTIFGIKNKEDQLLTAFYDTKITTTPIDKLEFKKTTLSELRQKLESYN